MILTDEAMEELGTYLKILSIFYKMDFTEVIEAIYCDVGEFTRLSSNVVRVKFEENCFLTLEIDQQYPNSSPRTSVDIELFSREDSDTFNKVHEEKHENIHLTHTLPTQEISEFSKSLGDGVDHKLSVILDFAKEKYNLMKVEVKQEANVIKVDTEMLVIKIDHMRKSGQYVKTLETWADNLAVHAALFVSSKQGLILVMEGSSSSISKYLLQWKTQNIDVDSRGKQCKEKMIQILYRQTSCENNVIETGLKNRSENSGYFQTIDCNDLFECVSNNLFNVLKSVL